MTSLLMAVVLQASVTASGEKTYAEAFSVSMKTGRPLVVMLGADWCPACVKLKTSIMPQVARQGTLKEVELAYVDVDKEPKLAGQLARGGSIPQLIRFEKTSRGWESRHMIGAQSVDKTLFFVSGGREEENKSAFPFSLMRSRESWAGMTELRASDFRNTSLEHVAADVGLRGVHPHALGQRRERQHSSGLPPSCTGNRSRSFVPQLLVIGRLFEWQHAAMKPVPLGCRQRHGGWSTQPTTAC